CLVVDGQAITAVGELGGRGRAQRDLVPTLEVARVLRQGCDRSRGVDRECARRGPARSEVVIEAVAEAFDRVAERGAGLELVTIAQSHGLSLMARGQSRPRRGTSATPQYIIIINYYYLLSQPSQPGPRM